MDKQFLIWFDILFWILISVFLFKRFFDVLGKDNGKSFGASDLLKNSSAASKDLSGDSNNDNVIEAKVIQKNDTSISDLEKIKKKLKENCYIDNNEKSLEKISVFMGMNPDFDLDKFVKGAENAYEMIVESFADKDLETLEFLLNEEVFASFKNDIEKRDEDKKILKTDVSKFLDVKIKDAYRNNKTNFIKVYFKTEQIIYIKNEKDEIIQGSKTNPAVIEDVWVFSKDNKTDVWKLSEILDSVGI